MSLAEIKKEIGKLNDSEHAELEVYLRQVRHWNSPKQLAELARRMREMDAGKKHTQEEVEALHQRLISEGR